MCALFFHFIQLIIPYVQRNGRLISSAFLNFKALYEIDGIKYHDFHIHNKLKADFLNSNSSSIFKINPFVIRLW